MGIYMAFYMNVSSHTCHYLTFNLLSQIKGTPTRSTNEFIKAVTENQWLYLHDTSKVLILKPLFDA